MIRLGSRSRRALHKLNYGRKSKHKYGAVRTAVDGITFASKAEAKRYSELKLLEKAGEIHDLVLQPRYPLHAGTSEELSLVGHYVADFAYLDKQNAQVVDEVKGYDVPLGKWKRRHFEAQYGIKVQVIR